MRKGATRQLATSPRHRTGVPPAGNSVVRRQMSFSEGLVSEVVAYVSSMSLTCPGVRSVDDHYAGYFDELGLTVNLEPSCQDEVWEPLAVQLLLYLNRTKPAGNPDFRWVLSFWRDLREIGLFFPGDLLHDNCASSELGPS